MYTHLLIPTDGTELSIRAVNSGVAFAKQLGAKISFLYVQPDFPIAIAGEGALLAPESREEFAQSTLAQAQRILGEAEAIANANGISTQVFTEVSDSPYQIIINTARAQSCDLVFMASHGRKGIVELLLGSEAHKVLTHCKIPVLVYR